MHVTGHPGDGFTLVALRTPTLPPATHTNCVVLGDGAVTLVDPASPWPEEQAGLFAWVAGLGLPVERVFLTHHHHDHVGAAEAVRRELGVPVVAHPITATLLAGAVEVDAVLDDGDVLRCGDQAWRAVYTPGHAPGHLCLWSEERGVLVAGDMVAGEGTIVLDPSEGHLGSYLASLERLVALEPRVVVPAHGPALEPGVERLRWYLEHRHERTAQVRRALAAGARRPDDVVGHVYGDHVPPFVRPLAALQVCCHLQWLADRGEAAGHADGTWTPT